MVFPRSSPDRESQCWVEVELCSNVQECWIPQMLMMVMMRVKEGGGHPESGRKNRRKVVSNPSTRGGRGMTHHHHHHHSMEDRTWDVPSQSKQPAQYNPHKHTYKFTETHTHRQTGLCSDTCVCVVLSVSTVSGILKFSPEDYRKQHYCDRQNHKGRGSAWLPTHFSLKLKLLKSLSHTKLQGYKAPTATSSLIYCRSRSWT